MICKLESKIDFCDAKTLYDVKPLYDFSQQIGLFSLVLHLYKVTCRPANISLLVNYGLQSAQRNNLFSQWSLQVESL